VNAADTVKLGVVLVLCMPAVVGTVTLWALNAGAQPSQTGGVSGFWAASLFLMAAYGPILVVAASVPAIYLTRGATDQRIVYAAWAAVLAGVAAAVGFWQFGIDFAPTL
jgi:hypothetical protein